jgi:hypothetical protein
VEQRLRPLGYKGGHSVLRANRLRLGIALMKVNLVFSLCSSISPVPGLLAGRGSALDLLRQIALELDLAPAHFRGDLVRQIADAIVRLSARGYIRPPKAFRARSISWP